MCWFLNTILAALGEGNIWQINYKTNSWNKKHGKCIPNQEECLSCCKFWQQLILIPGKEGHIDTYF